MHAHLAIGHSAEKIMQNVIINHDMTECPLFSIKTADGDQILQKKPNSHSHHLPRILLFHLPRFATDTTKNNDTISSSGVPYPNNPEDLNIGIPNPEINIKTDDEKFFEIFEKISPLIDELDTLVSAYKSPDEKDKILSDGIMLALMSPNPVRSIKDMINLHRLYNGIKKASDSVANSKKITPEQAQLILRTMVLTAPYSKNENKFNK